MSLPQLQSQQTNSKLTVYTNTKLNSNLNSSSNADNEEKSYSIFTKCVMNLNNMLGPAM